MGFDEWTEEWKELLGAKVVDIDASGPEVLGVILEKDGKRYVVYPICCYGEASLDFDELR